MRTTAIHTTAWCLALLLAGCDPDAGGGMATPEDNGRSLIFTAAIGSNGSSGLSVTTRVATAETDSARINAAMDETRDSLLKKTFDYSSGNADVIRICNVESNTAAPDFELSDNGRTYEYECSRYTGDYEDTGSKEEDDHVAGNHTTYSEYEFVPHEERGFYIGNLVNDGNNYFCLYAAWWRGYSHPKDGMVSMGIAEDQSEKEDFLNSDLLLAFVGHNIDKFEEPIRLIFHHSFSMLDVRVEVPVYVPGNKEDEEQSLPSGYRMDDVRMSMTNVPTQFTVGSTNDINGGDLVEVVPTEGAEPVDEIPMYCYYVEDRDKENSSDAGHEGEDMKDDDSKTSKYRTYGFCGILPPIQQLETDRPLLRLHLKDPLTEKDEAYIYTPVQEAGSDGLMLSGEHISVLRLKLYRSMKQMLVISAEVKPWEKATGTLDLMEEFDEEE